MFRQVLVSRTNLDLHSKSTPVGSLLLAGRQLQAGQQQNNLLIIVVRYQHVCVEEADALCLFACVIWTNATAQLILSYILGFKETSKFLVCVEN